MALLPVCTLFLLLASSVMVPGQPTGDFPGGLPGGARRVIRLNRDTFLPALKANPFLVIFFMYVTDKSYAQMQEQQMELAAASTQGQKVKFAIINMQENKLLAKELGLSPIDSIHIYRKDHLPQEYFGQRAAQFLVPYIMEMMSPVINKIEGKQQKKRYEQFEFAKVVAYVDQDGKMLPWYRKAAEHFRPIVPFYEVYDKKLARNLRLKQMNTIHFVKPYEKFLPVPPNVTNDRALIKFIYENRRQSLFKLRMSEIHLCWSHLFSPNLFASFIKHRTREGTRFLSTLKSVSQQFLGNGSLHFVWIDPDDFPHLMEQWRHSYGIDMSQSHFGFGYIKMITSQHGWFDTDAQQPTVKNIRWWIDAVLSGQVELRNTTLSHTSAEKEEAATPTEEEAEEDDSEKRTEL